MAIIIHCSILGSHAFPQQHLVSLASSPCPGAGFCSKAGQPQGPGSQLCKCFQLLCDWSLVLLFDLTPRQARPWLFLAAAGDERMSA